MAWPKRIVEWTDNGTACISVSFTWLLPEAYQRAVWLSGTGHRVQAGGPAVSLMPDYLADVAEVGGEVDALPRHNPNATFTSRGCIRRCPFCAVPLIEGDLRELKSWEPKPIVCDNNLLACSRRHFDQVIDRLKGVPGVDFNQGLDARLLTPYHADRLAELDLAKVRLAWDRSDEGNAFMAAYERLRRAGIPKSKIKVYVLIGFNDDPQDAWFRLRTLRNVGLDPFAMRYQPLDTLVKDSYVASGWTDSELRRYQRYWNNLRSTGGAPFEEFR
jgi:hypothetical protein